MSGHWWLPTKYPSVNVGPLMVPDQHSSVNIVAGDQHPSVDVGPLMAVSPTPKCKCRANYDYQPNIQAYTVIVLYSIKRHTSLMIITGNVHYVFDRYSVLWSDTQRSIPATVIQLLLYEQRMNDLLYTAPSASIRMTELLCCGAAPGEQHVHLKSHFYEFWFTQFVMTRGLDLRWCERRTRTIIHSCFHWLCGCDINDYCIAIDMIASFLFVIKKSRSFVRSCTVRYNN